MESIDKKHEIRLKTKDWDIDKFCRAARNPKTSLEGLEVLIEKNNNKINFFLTLNPNLTLLMLSKIARCNNAQVVSKVAEHRNCTERLLNRLIKIKNRRILEGCLNSPNLTYDLLKEMALNPLISDLALEKIDNLLKEDNNENEPQKNEFEESEPEEIENEDDIEFLESLGVQEESLDDKNE